jgi:carboxypeptidase Taq
MSLERVDEIFSNVRTAVVPLIKSVLSSPHKPSLDCLSGHFPVEAQKSLNAEIVEWTGFTGRSDVSVHPFTTSFSSSDVRITTRYADTAWYQALAGTIHEVGHGLYEANLSSEPLEINKALSMGVHESQSLFWERHVGLSKEFWDRWTPSVNKHLHTDFTSQEVHEAVNSVSRSAIRVEADELTYPLHVILRYEIEKSIINNECTVADIPSMWNRKMKEFLDVDVTSDNEGCLQDIHWSGIAIGYFPTYLIGAVGAAQLEHYIRLDMDFDDVVSRGDSSVIVEWLNKKIHKHGRYHESIDDLFRDVFGEKLDEKYYIEYLVKKYEKLYRL